MKKYTKSTFHDRDNKAHAVLERIHSDVCGPFSTGSIAGHKIFIIFFMTSHGSARYSSRERRMRPKFVEFKALVEKERNKKVKALRSDNGGEYVSNEFKNLCAKEGIQRMLKAPQNPQ